MIENWASLRMIKNSQGFWLDLWQYILTPLSSHEYSILLFYIIVHVSRNDSVLRYSVRQRPWLIVKSWNQSPVRTKRFNYIIGSACFFITKKLFFSTFQTRFKRVFFWAYEMVAFSFRLRLMLWHILSQSLILILQFWRTTL